jgi:hypothetical protein
MNVDAHQLLTKCGQVTNAQNVLREGGFPVSVTRHALLLTEAGAQKMLSQRKKLADSG